MSVSALAPLFAAGLQVDVMEGGCLAITPAHVLTDDLRRYIREHKQEIVGAARAANEPSTNCRYCVHLRRPGLSSGYCSAREDLPPAYGEAHPLRQCPPDKGAACTRHIFGPRWH